VVYIRVHDETVLTDGITSVVLFPRKAYFIGFLCINVVIQLMIFIQEQSVPFVLLIVRNMYF